MAKAKPGQISYASSGNGSAQHLAGALFEDRAGVKLSHIPYQGGGPAMNDVMAGQVPLFLPMWHRHWGKSSLAGCARWLLQPSCAPGLCPNPDDGGSRCRGLRGA